VIKKINRAGVQILLQGVRFVILVIVISKHFIIKLTTVVWFAHVVDSNITPSVVFSDENIYEQKQKNNICVSLCLCVISFIVTNDKYINE
jgi:hypothetical protein